MAWVTATKNRSAWRSSPGFTASHCAHWTTSRTPTRLTATLCRWRTPRARRNVKASDESELQFHQPDESITGATVIADARVATPEQILASDELLRLIASALRDLGSGPREAFILHTLEGFTVDEIAGITGHPAERVLAFVSAARDHLRKAPALARQFQGRFAPTGAA